MKHIDSTLYF